MGDFVLIVRPIRLPDGTASALWGRPPPGWHWREAHALIARARTAFECASELAERRTEAWEKRQAVHYAAAVRFLLEAEEHRGKAKRGCSCCDLTA